MLTQKGANTCVVGVHGNFDDAQTGVKKMFNDPALHDLLDQNGYQFSSANSINIGRLVPQIAYYVWAYSRMVKNGNINCGDQINFVVPTGNFGNILAGYYAKLMGLPVKTLVCASNDNKVLYDFFETGTYDKNREFILTTSPSMDILISSNLERLIYMLAGEDEIANRQFMRDLTEKGIYSITPDMKEKLASFKGGFASEEENAQTINKIYNETGYITDTHTGVAACVYDKYKEASGDDTPSVIVSTASPYKFATAVMEAVDPAYHGKDDMVLIDELERISGVAMPQAILDIKNAEIMHDKECDICDMRKTVTGFLGIK